MTESDILRRVRALLDKAESTTYEAERDAYMQKAQALMLRHAIDEAMLTRDPRAKTQVPISKIFTYTEGKGYHEAKSDLLWVVAEHNRCKTMFWTKRQSAPDKSRQCSIVGYPDDVAFVEMLYTSLWLQLVSAGIKAHDLADAEWDERLGRDRQPHRKSFIAAFANGFIYEVGRRMREANRQATREAEQETTGSELALVDRKREISRFYDELFPKTKTFGGSRNRGSEEAYFAGAHAGKEANIGQSGLSRGAKALPGS